eukprot:TRINITY_DN831_c0_g1_i1.p1 TRINITY_DN831_c0_g1~~TRINITY_DN831_c0_g1_i1.p1  ORF type:complete len:253 (+),score=88.40 TRINITY_DN831_c0_g1_i1:81-839(+)
MTSAVKNLVFMVGRGVRETGQALDRLGCRLQNNYAFMERLSRHKRLMSFYDRQPFVGEGAFLAPNASVIGKVEVGEGSSVWYGAVLRGDVQDITIGKRSSIGDRVVIHVSKHGQGGPAPTIVGDDCVVEQGVILHACTVEDGVHIGSGSILYDGSYVEKGAIIEPGTVLTAGKRVPGGQVWGGSPAQFKRNATPEDIEAIKKTAQQLKQLGDKHATEHNKTEAQRQMERYTNHVLGLEKEEPADTNPRTPQY